ncbi:hypothetical protein DPMN_031561 [Dreissena polymorpha]|uniref:Uncharacterized protein n=1 Tax=Dreissena polymorpha TaxID=45954 RepID=A0A9D4M2E1_DREPO|nr:hypothetical protein DPMN_031561 [Dreissena polymorpha]
MFQNFTVFYHYESRYLETHNLRGLANRVYVTKNSTIISNLTACDVYFFRVAVTNQDCSLSEIVALQTGSGEGRDQLSSFIHPQSNFVFEPCTEKMGFNACASSVVPDKLVQSAQTDQ